MKDEIGSFLLWLIYLFRFFGFCPISFHPKSIRNKSENKIIFVWSICVIISLNLIMLMVYVRSHIFLYVEERFALFNDYLKLSATIVSVNVSSWQSLKMRNQERTFWTLYIKLRASRNPIVKKMTIYDQLHEHRWFICKFFGIVSINISLYLAFALLSTEMPQRMMMFWIMYTPYTVAIGIRNAQYVLYMHLIHLEVEYLEKDLATLVEFTEWERPNRSFPHFDEFIRRCIVEKQRIYQTIFEMTGCFQKACNWSMVVHLLRGYTRILVDCYYCLWSLTATWLKIKDILLVPAILEIPLFLLTAKNCTNAANNISYRVHNLKHSAENIATSIQIQNFSLQLLHQKIKIDGLGIASMDGYMLTKAVGSITTYMVFFIQFMPKFKSKFD